MARPVQEIPTYVPARWATDAGREFDPTTEVHHFGFVVKAVDPGCTMEIQVEERDGRVARVTMTESPGHDREAIRKAVMAALDRFLDNFA